MTAIYASIALLGVIGGTMIPVKCRRYAVGVLMTVFFLGLSAILWTVFGPEDYLLWIDAQWYQKWFHPWVAALFGISVGLISGSALIGLFLRCLCKQ